MRKFMIFRLFRRVFLSWLRKIHAFFKLKRILGRRPYDCRGDLEFRMFKDLRVEDILLKIRWQMKK
jgi:hypothetical protein